MKNVLFSIALIALVGLLPKASKAQLIQIDGSSTVFPVTEAVSEEYQKAKKGAVKVTVGIAGTGGGFKKFCRGEIDISNASRPILKAEMETCKQSGVQYVELPVDDCGRTQEDLGTGGSGKSDKLESSADQLAKCAVEAVRRGRRFGNVRLFY